MGDDGPYDWVAVREAEDPAAVAQLMLIAGRIDDVTFQTILAFSEDEFAAIADKLSPRE